MSGRKSRVFARMPDESLPLAVRGEGCCTIDQAGRHYFDGFGGAVVSCLGHGDKAVNGKALRP